ncbi:MAG: hypothetical protein ACJ74P_06040 [Gaiellaceae bacterium]|jgi:hypothetical protein
MPPKKPTELREQIESQQDQPAIGAGMERTAEGMETRTPSRDEFFGNLRKTSKPERK